MPQQPKDEQGLSAEQIEAFINDERPEAFADVIEELLASPR